MKSPLALFPSSLFLAAASAFAALPVAHGAVPELGWMAALCEVAALTVLTFATRERAAEPNDADALREAA